MVLKMQIKKTVTQFAKLSSKNTAKFANHMSRKSLEEKKVGYHLSILINMIR